MKLKDFFRKAKKETNTLSYKYLRNLATNGILTRNELIKILVDEFNLDSLLSHNISITTLTHIVLLGKINSNYKESILLYQPDAVREVQNFLLLYSLMSNRLNNMPNLNSKKALSDDSLKEIIAFLRNDKLWFVKAAALFLTASTKKVYIRINK